MPPNLDINDEIIQDTEYLKDLDELRGLDCCLLRALVPLKLLPDVPMVSANPPRTVLRGPFPASHSCSFTDGAGGESGNIPVRRRTAFAAVSYPIPDPCLPRSGPVDAKAHPGLMVCIDSDGKGTL